MVDTLTLFPSKGSSVQRTRASATASWADNWKQAKGEEHMLAGVSDDNKQQYRHLLQFDMPDWDEIVSVSRAMLHVFTANDHVGFKTQGLAAPADNLKAAYKTKSWSEAGGGETVWTGDLGDGGADFSDNYRGYAYVSAGNLHESLLNVLPIIKAWAPANVKVGGSAGLGKGNYGVVLGYAGTDPIKHQTATASHKHVDTSIRPFLVLEVELKGGPGVVVLGPPDGDIAAGVPNFLTGEYEPGRPHDKIAKVQLKWSIGGGEEHSWTVNPTSNDVATSTFSVPVPVSFKSQTLYEWTARVQNQLGEWTPYAAKNTLRLTTSPPSVSAVEPHGTLVTLDSVLFRASYLATVGEYRASGWQVQLRSQLVATDPTWGEDLIWDTGWMTVPLSNANQQPGTGTMVQYLGTPYGGPGLTPSTTYSYRIRARDAFGGTSNWQYGSFSLSAAYVPPTADIRTNLTSFGKQPPFRIRIFGMGANRGPGSLVAELTDASNVGGSEFYNSPGELYFTLPATHPQVSVIEPYQTHYALEEHTGQGWTGKAYGLITDFDADADEVVFYGQDYLALLGRTVEERFDPVNAELPTDKGGAKYVDQTIKDVIYDQLSKERVKANSPVGFIQVALSDIADMSEKVTIYASFKQRLPFIAGLIESSRAGTGRKTRLVCERDINGVFRWKVLFNPGIDRPNLKLVYGELIQGFRTVPFAQWGTAIDALGRTVLGTKVYSARSVAPGISEATYGAFPSTTMYSDIDDLNDLRRRAAQAAAKVAKVGKMMGLALRVGALNIKDGWDITDNVPVEIQRGVVDTTRFGSGYYTIWGWTWNSYPDGHTNMVLSLSPREDTVPPNPDLIPSSPILDIPTWQVKDRPPTTEDDGEFWLDTTTGDIWERGDDGVWTNTGNLQGPPGSPGALIGDYVWMTAPDTSISAGQVSVGLLPGRLKVNVLYIAQVDIGGSDRGAYLAAVEPGDALLLPVGDFLWRVEVTALGVDHGTFWTFPVVWPGHPTGQPPATSATRITVALGAVPRPVPGSGLGRFEFGPDGVSAPPAGQITVKVLPTTRVPNGINIADTDLTSVTRRPYLSTVRMGDTLMVDDGDGTLMKVVVDGPPVDHTTWWEFPFTDIQPLITVGVAVDATVASPGAAGPAGPAGPIGLPLGDWKWEETRGLPPPGYVALSLPPLVPDGGAPGDRLLDDITGEPLYPDLP